MSRQPGFLDPDDRYALLSKPGDPSERLASAANVEAFRFRLEKALKRSRLSGGSESISPRLACQALDMDKLHARFNAALERKGYCALSGQIIDVSLIAAPASFFKPGDSRA